MLVLVRSAAAGASEVPVIDIGALFGDDETAQLRVARAIRSACVEWGFFYISQHGIDASLIAELAAVSREFFALPADEKSAIEMARAGRAWRGFFPVGGEFTSGKPDQKEGIYFGEELPADDERVRAGRPMHGANLFPARPASMRAVVLRYMAEMRKLANVVMRGIALALELPRDFFERDVTADPLQLFRIFHYPALGSSSSDPDAWSVGAHTDYGLLTLLLQDDVGGLQVKSASGSFIDAPPIDGTFVCNLGDMLEKITGGLFKSTLHRVRNSSNRSRLSWPYFFDPSWNTVIRPLPGFQMLAVAPDDEAKDRWDGVSVHAAQGTYGQWLLQKTAKVFPDLHVATRVADEL